MSRQRRRVLVLAEAANPEWASVPLIGWSLSQALRGVADAHLVTHVRNRDAILRAGLREGSDFTAIDNEAIAKPMWKLADLIRGGEGRGWTTMMAFSALAYYSFEWAVWRQFGDRLRSGEFDLVHRITPVSQSNQSLMAGWLARHNIPFVLGPINGGLAWPKNFGQRQLAEREFLSPLRSLFKLLPGYRSTLRHSAAILAGARHIYEGLPSAIADKRIYLPENAVDTARLGRPRDRKASAPLRVAFIGRLVPLKAVDVLIEAAREFQARGKLELLIVGDGPERTRLEAMVAAFGTGETTRFAGWTPHVEAMDLLKDCDALVLPSVREFGGGVALEAMALGVAPIVADYGGPAELVSDGCGARIPFHDPASLRAGLQRALAQVVANPQLLDQWGAAARQRALAQFTWEAKADQIAEIYDAILTGKGRLSSLGLPLPAARSSPVAQPRDARLAAEGRA